MSKKRSVTSRPAAADRGAPPPPTAPESAPTMSAEDQMRDTTNAMGLPMIADPVTALPSVAGSDEADANADAGATVDEALDNADPGPVLDDSSTSLDLGVITADRYRLILALERAAIYGHGLDSDRALHMEAAAMIRALLDLAPDADLTQPYTTGPVVNDPPIGDSL